MPTYVLLITCYENIEEISKDSWIYNTFDKFLTNMDIHINYCCELIFLIVAVVVFVILKIIIPYLIVFKDSYSSIYQDFFINEIIRMTNMNPDIFLLIEDMDRLNTVEADNVFRIISAINRAGQYKHEFMGLLSYSSKNLCKNGIGSLLIDIENKVCVGNIGVGYNESDSKKEFLKNIFEDKLKKEVDMSNMYESIQKLNFRDVSEFVETYVIGIEYDNVETIIKKLKVFSTRKEQERVNNKKLSKED